MIFLLTISFQVYVLPYVIRQEKEIYGIQIERASLVAQWIRILLPMQGTWVRALVWEDPTCCGATKPMLHNY